MKKTLREICTDIGVSRRAVQGYEKIGLVSPSGKNKYGHLLYGEEEEARIRLIYLYREVGLPLKEIVRIMDAPVAERKALLQAQIKKMEVKIDHLDTMIQRLSQHLEELD